MRKDISAILLSTILILVFLALLLILLFSEGEHYYRAQNLVMDGIYTEVEGIAAYAASSIPGELHEKIQVGDELSENFLYLNSIIGHIATNYPRINYIYTIRKEGDFYSFILDSDEEEAWIPGESIGVPIEVVPDALALVFAGQVTHTDTFYTDEWGSFISGYAPIFSSSGEVIAVLAVDVSKELITEEIEEVRSKLLIRIILITTVGLIATLLGVYATLHLLNSNKLMKSAQNVLLQATTAAQEGAFEYDVSSDILLCGPETAKLVGYNVEPGIETYALSKDFLVEKAVYEDKGCFCEILSSINQKIDPRYHKKITHTWRFHVDDRIKAIRFKGYVTPKNEKELKIIGMAEDYTEQEKNKTALININNKIEILHSISSHDIKNIITAIYTYADLILEEEIPDSVKADIDILIQNSEYSISTISSFSNVYKTLGTNSPEWIDIKALVNDVFRSHADLKHIKFTNNIDNVDIYADPHFDFVIQALFEFSINHCLITNVSMYSTISKDALHIIYEDDGIGISEYEKKRIFDFDVTKKDKTALFIVREILSITGISIEEDGTDESGVRFVITVKPGWFRLIELES